MNKKIVRGETALETLYLNCEWADHPERSLGKTWWQLRESGLDPSCLIWKGPSRSTSSTFGYFTFEGKTYSTHRLAVEEEYGYRPNRLRNTCGETLCINTNHWEETEKDARPNRGAPVARVSHVKLDRHHLNPWRVRLIACQTMIADYYYSTESHARKAADRLTRWASVWYWDSLTGDLPEYLLSSVPSRLELISKSARFPD